MSSERPAWLEKDSNLSLASEADVIQNGRLLIWTVHPTLSAYQTVFAGGVVTRAIKVSAAVVVAIPPTLAVYPFLQRYFTRGVLSGAVKEPSKGEADPRNCSEYGVGRVHCLRLDLRLASLRLRPHVDWPMYLIARHCQSAELVSTRREPSGCRPIPL